MHKRLLDWMASKHITDAELAIKAGVSYSTVRRAMSGIAIGKLAGSALSHATNLPLSEFIHTTRQGKPKQEDALAPQVAEPIVIYPQPSTSVDTVEEPQKAAFNKPTKAKKGKTNEGKKRSKKRAG